MGACPPAMSPDRIQLNVRCVYAAPDMRPNRLSIVVLSVSELMVGCDGPGYVNVDNRSASTYVAQTGSGQFLVVPPKHQVTVAQIPFAGVEHEGAPKLPVRLLDSSCNPVAEPVYYDTGTIVIESTGTVKFEPGDVGAADGAEAAGFCSDAAPIATPTPYSP
jgi:hypothetical protein